MQHLSLVGLVITLALSLTSQSALGAESEKAMTLRQLMTSAQFTQAGLGKLTSTELHALDAWLNLYTEAVTRVVLAGARTQAPTSPTPPPTSTPQVIETCIEDEFEGWDGDTVFKMCNGQIWQQSEYDYEYHYAYRPDVVIYRSGSGYRMKVEDMAETVGVKRLK